MSVYIIAEAGVNHNGSLETAYKLVDVAKEAGVDCIKFQTFKADKLASADSKKAEYQIRNSGDESQLDMLKKLELSYDDFKKLKKYCDKVEIAFLSTPFDLESIEFLNTIDMPFWKVPSGEITNLPYLIALAETGKPMIISTGMCGMDEIDEALSLIKEKGVDDIKLLHCNTEYPTPFEDVNLRAMNTIRERFDLEVGYSDHTRGIEVPIAAVAMGATVIEKHFTLDRNMEGPDHKASLEPDELKAMVKAIRNIEQSFGTGIKEPSPSERKNIVVARKSIVAACDIKEGTVLSEENLAVKRPGDGISPMKWFEVIGTKAVRDFKEDEQIQL